MRIVAAVAALGLWGCSTTSPAVGAPRDAGAGDEGVGCLFCSDATDDAPLAVQVKGKIDQICANVDGCHGESEGHMALNPGSEFDAMIDVESFENPPMKRVLPGDPLQSYVFLKLWCDGGLPDGSACMPYGSPPDPKLAQLFHDWIEAGAPTP
ncbi:MAG TPA: hypothetical protein VHS09_03670 [Polyangiaceae bacterium]|jgi:hypothetical protein|nr:hypothetical protein [Polyangiaceae bacterium]